MSDAPSVLLLDDGELDRIHRALKRIGADYLRLQGREIKSKVERPRDVLITSGPRSFECPELEDSGEPTDGFTWVCVHNQDFLPLRDRLRGLGVHLLVHSGLDEDSLRILLLQLLHRGPERRETLRLPLGGQVNYRIGSSLGDARLAELSGEMCRIFSTEPIASEAAISVFLPSALGGGEELEIQGHTLRSALCESRTGAPAFSTVVRVNDLEPETRAQLERIVRGQQIGTRVTPLAARSSQASQASPEIEREPEERRREPRSDYQRRVDVLDFGDAGEPGSGLGHDLSTTGVRVMGLSGLAEGSEVTLAMYGGNREEPAVVDASVVRDDGEAGIALRFGSLSDSQRQQIEKLMGGRPALESLQGGGGEPERLVVTQVTPRTGTGSGR